MPGKLEESKLALRRQVRAAVQALPMEKRSDLSAKARARLLEQPTWRNARTILFYAPLPEELDVWPLIAEAESACKAVCLPRFMVEWGAYVACRIESVQEEIQTGHFGIREPVESCATVELKRLDLILVPGIGFDRQGRRLGRGKGFYDRLLANVEGKTCGVAFDEQMVERIPIGPHDRNVNCILTPTRWLEF